LALSFDVHCPARRAANAEQQGDGCASRCHGEEGREEIANLKRAAENQKRRGFGEDCLSGPRAVAEGKWAGREFRSRRRFWGYRGHRSLAAARFRAAISSRPSSPSGK